MALPIRRPRKRWRRDATRMKRGTITLKAKDYERLVELTHAIKRSINGTLTYLIRSKMNDIEIMRARIRRLPPKRRRLHRHFLGEA